MTSTFKPMPTRASRLGGFPFNANHALKGASALICFSHLRWNFVYQRPQHLMTRMAAHQPVFFFEEPVVSNGDKPMLIRTQVAPHVTVLVPHLPHALSDVQKVDAQRRLLQELIETERLTRRTFWYYTPMSLEFSTDIQADVVVYDCMDELSAFRGAPASLIAWEKKLFAKADVVFTGGFSLFEAKRALHPNVHAFPSSVDIDHFKQARTIPAAPPEDQAAIPTPRLGFFGVIDERFDIELVGALATARPDWHFVLVGPVVKIDPATLPHQANIHYLGSKSYEELPRYLAGWDVALMPFARNESTRYISPTKTPEYLAGGRIVVSTPIADVVSDYRDGRVVKIADGPEAFETAIVSALAHASSPAEIFARCDVAIEGKSWDHTVSEMRKQLVRLDPVKPLQAASANTAVNVLHAIPQHADYDYLIVGAGFAGSVLAERLACDSGKRVLVVDKRSHIGGNAYDYYDAAGILVHQYGPHIFHTNAKRIVDYLSQFTQWRPYEHRVLAKIDEQLVPLPINLTTLEMLYDRTFTPESAQTFLDGLAVAVENPKTSEDIVVSRIGRDLYEKFYRGYTRKQWGLDPSELDAAVAARIPIRTNDDDRYFDDEFQQMPANGYTAMFERMLAHPNIAVLLDTDFATVAKQVNYRELVYTGRVDEYFNYQYGPLPYRSLRFEHKTVDTETFQAAGVVNYPSVSVPYTRVTEYKYLTGQTHPQTSLTYEFPGDEGDPYYPVPRPENAALYAKYRDLADASPDVTFVGRLATYRYYNMDQVVAQALATYDRMCTKVTPTDGLEAVA